MSQAKVSLKSELIRIITFLFVGVGVANAALDYLVFWPVLLSVTKLVRFFLVACTIFVPATVAVVYLSEFMPVYVAKIASIVVSLALNYGLSHVLVFKSS